MDLNDIQFLQSSEGERWLAELEKMGLSADNTLPIATKLRKSLPQTHIHALIETTLLREKGKAKFSRANEMLFLRDALEQASSELISDYRAQRYVGKKTADLGCGIGGDLLGLANVGESIGIDLNPVRLQMAAQNLAVYGREADLIEANLLALAPLPVDAIFFDPARRDERGKRIHSVEQYRPPLSLVNKWRDAGVEQVGVKLSPAVDLAELPEQVEVEFIAVKNELKEAVAWYGALGTGVRTRATILPSGETLVDDGAEVEVAEVKPYLYEPNPAVLRAGLVQTLGHQLGATMIDGEIGFLSADAHQQTPFATAFIVEDVLPFGLKKLRTYLRQRNIGRVTIKKRGSPLDVVWLEKQLRLKGDKDCWLILTQAQGEPVVIVAIPFQG